MTDYDLFTYPPRPGFKEHGTSREAAVRISPSATALRADVLSILSDRELTADEIAARLGKSILSIRPRVSELNKLQLIEKTGERRANASGMSAAVWRAKR